MKVLSYRTVLRKEPEGGYTVIVPSLPGCVTYGENIDHAISMAREAIELYVESLQSHGEDGPTYLLSSHHEATRGRAVACGGFAKRNVVRDLETSRH